MDKKEFIKTLSLGILVDLTIKMTEQVNKTQNAAISDRLVDEINLIDDEIKIKAKALGMWRGKNNELVLGKDTMSTFTAADGIQKAAVEIPIQELVAFSKWLESLSN